MRIRACLVKSSAFRTTRIPRYPATSERFFVRIMYVPERKIVDILVFQRGQSDFIFARPLGYIAVHYRDVHVVGGKP